MGMASGESDIDIRTHGDSDSYSDTLFAYAHVS